MEEKLGQSTAVLFKYEKLILANSCLITSFQTIKKPRDTLSLGQADAGREKAARETPHPPADVVSSSAKINFSHLNRTAVDCPSFSSIARPRVTNLKMGKLYYSIISHHLFSLEEGFAPQPNL